jgi:uncharacterized repeat protein (TIGR03803 family)
MSMQTKSPDLRRYMFGICSLVAVLAGCGGSNNGTVPAAAAQSAIRAAASMDKSYNVLHRFSGADGADVGVGLIEANHVLYGTTSSGGGYDRGSFYRITQTGDEKVLYSFGSRSDGAKPEAGLIDVNGTFFGTTEKGGSANQGTIYSMKVLVRGIGVETLLHSFAGYPNDGDRPFAGLVNVNGTLYGTTFGGGSAQLGTVYSISASGKETVLHSFGGGADGASPYAGLADVNGTIYGTTSFGGDACPKINQSGCGTVFSISTTGEEKVLYSFTGGSDGAYPQARLRNVKGTLYGTTLDGGGPCNSGEGCGTVFSISTGGAEKILHSFNTDDGYAIYAGLTDANGTLYGAAAAGGKFGRGVIYSISTTGKFKELHTFETNENGWQPNAAPIDVSGTLYGTTEFGGGLGCKNFAGCGTVYALTLSASGGDEQRK